jgi:flagellar biosynthetic protein FliP
MGKRKLKIQIIIAVFIVFFLFAGVTAAAAEPLVSIDGSLFDESPESASTVMKLLLVLTVLTLLPSILIMMTGFTRIVIVLSFTRNAMNTQQAPPNQVIIGLALFLTLFIMRQKTEKLPYRQD